jgi:hypothetical protein
VRLSCCSLAAVLCPPSQDHAAACRLQALDVGLEQVGNGAGAVGHCRLSFASLTTMSEIDCSLSVFWRRAERALDGENGSVERSRTFEVRSPRAPDVHFRDELGDGTAVERPADRGWRGKFSLTRARCSLLGHVTA